MRNPFRRRPPALKLLRCGRLRLKSIPPVPEMNSDRRPVASLGLHPQPLFDAAGWHGSRCVLRLDLAAVGLPYPLSWREARAYVAGLNRVRLAAHDRWRLPTTPELMSLLTPTPRGRDFCIEPIFDLQQKTLWSSDRRSFTAAWFVNIEMGFVGAQDFSAGFYARAVCSFITPCPGRPSPCQLQGFLVQLQKVRWNPGLQNLHDGFGLNDIGQGDQRAQHADVEDDGLGRSAPSRCGRWEARAVERPPCAGSSHSGCR